MISDKLLETEIKAKVINYLLSQGLNSLGTSLLNEYSVDSHSRRVDLLLVISLNPAI